MFNMSDETSPLCTKPCNCTTRSLPVELEPSTNEVEKMIWDRVCGFYPGGFIDLISPQIPNLPNWASKLYGQGRKLWRGEESSKNPCFPTEESDLSYSINFADMQRLYMRYLQAKLINFAVANQFDADKGFCMLGEFTATMREYVQALQDHEYMKTFSKQPNDPFLASGSRIHDQILLDHAITPELVNGLAGAFLSPAAEGDSRSGFERLLAKSMPTGPWEMKPKPGRGVKPVGTTRGESIKRALWSRMLGAIIGGVFLVGPMWLLVLERDKWVHLGVTTGCVFGFGFLASWFLNTLESVFAATFAYAAVLMVFVGVMMQEQSA